MADDIDAIKKSFNKTQFGMQDSIADAFEDAATKRFGSLGSKFAAIFTKQVNDVFSKVTPDLSADLGRNVGVSLSSGIEDGMVGGAESAAEEIRDRFAVLTSDIKGQWDNALGSLPGLALIGAAAEAQNDMSNTIITQTGFMTDEFDKFNSVVTDTTALLGLTQDEALAITKTFYSQGLQFQFNREQIMGLNESTSVMAKLFDMAADEAAQTVMHLTRLGMSKTAIDKLTKSTFQLGSSLGLSQEEMRDVTVTSSDLIKQMAFAGPDSIKKMTEALSHLKAGYRQMGIDSQAAIETLSGVITGSEEGRLLTARMAQQFGVSFGDMLTIAETEGDRFIAMRNRLAADTLFSEAQLTTSDLLNLDPDALREQFSQIFQVMGPQLENLYGMSRQEIAGMTRSFTMATGEQLEAIKKMAEEGKSAGEILSTLFVPKKGQGRTSEEGLEAFNKQLGKTMEALTSIGHALLIDIGMPILKAVTPALEMVVPLAKELYSWLKAIPGLLPVIATFIGLISGLSLLKLTFSILSATKAFFSLGGAFTTVIALGSKVGSAFSMLGGVFTTFLTIGAKLLVGLKALGVAILGVSLPVWGIIAAVAAVGVAIYALWKNWDTVSTWMSDSWKSLKDVVLDFVDFVVGFLPASIVNGLSSAGSAITEAITAPFSTAWDMVSGIFSDTETQVTLKAKNIAMPAVEQNANIEKGHAAALQTQYNKTVISEQLSQQPKDKTQEADFSTKALEDKIDALISVISGDVANQARFREVIARKLSTGSNAAIHDLIRGGAL